VVLIAAGASLLGWAALTLRRARTAIYPGHSTTTIVTTGPYRFSRNPMYVGLAIGYVGAALAIRGVWPLTTLIPCLLVVRYGIVGREEAYLAGKFGQEYLVYTREVRRWLAVLISTSLPVVFPN
jgi:protein-S-isoprenylcysteine O-methyltransferase Ste14